MEALARFDIRREMLTWLFLSLILSLLAFAASAHYWIIGVLLVAMIEFRVLTFLIFRYAHRNRELLAASLYPIFLVLTHFIPMLFYFGTLSASGLQDPKLYPFGQNQFVMTHIYSWGLGLFWFIPATLYFAWKHARLRKSWLESALIVILTALLNYLSYPILLWALD